MLESYVIAFSTSFPSKISPQSLVGEFLLRIDKSWIRSSPNQEPLSSFSLDSEEDVRALSDFIHSSLDDLPCEESFHLDVVWDLGFGATKIPLALFGALKRATEWHGALLHACGGPLSGPLAECISPMTTSVEIQPCLWRGHLAFFHGLDESIEPYEELKGFSLAASSYSTPKSNILPPGTKTLSRSLFVVSHNIDLSSVPKAYFKDPIHLSFDCEKENELIDFFQAKYLRSKRQALLLRLEVSSNTKDFGSQLKTSQWTQVFTAEEDPDPRGCLKSSLGKQPESVFILVMGGSEGKRSFQGWTLGSEGCHLFEGFHLRENKLNSMEIPLYKFPENIDLNAFMEFLKVTEAKILKTLSEVEPYLVEEGCLDLTLGVIRRRIAERMGFSATADGTYHTQETTPNETEEERVEVEMKHFLKFLSEQQRLKEEAKARLHSRPEAGYIKWEVKELLQFFRQDGLARIKNSQTEVLSSTTKRSLPDPSDQSWPQVLRREDVMDVVYNLGDESEAKDRKRMEILKTHVGLLKETISTGSARTSSPDIIPVSSKKATHKGDEVELTPRVLRSSPRKKTTSASKEDIFKQKLRNAVFSALSSKGIGVKHELFRPCFKKLFEICKMFTGSKGPGGQGSTKEWLNKVALQNVEPVISLEKTLQSSSN